MGVELCQVEMQKGLREQECFDEEEKWVGYMRKLVAREIAIKVLERAATYETFPPPKDKPWLPTIYRWTIGIETGADELALRAAQLEDARTEERERIVGLLRRIRPFDFERAVEIIGSGA